MFFGDELKKIIAAVLIVCCSTTAMSHGGGTNSDGCHNDNKNGGYHCHGGGNSGGGSSDDGSSAGGIVGGIIAGLLILYAFKKYRENSSIERYSNYKNDRITNTNYQPINTGNSSYQGNNYWGKYYTNGASQANQIEENQATDGSVMDRYKPNTAVLGCGEVKSCNELTSCEDAKFHLNVCKNPNVDKLCELKICEAETQ